MLLSNHLGVLAGVLTGVIGAARCCTSSAPVVLLYGASPMAVKGSSGWARVGSTWKHQPAEFHRIDLGGIGAKAQRLRPIQQEVTRNWIYVTESGDSFAGVWISGSRFRVGRSRTELAATDPRLHAECKRAIGKLYPLSPDLQSLEASLSGETGPLQQGWEINLDGRGMKELVLVANSRLDLGVEAHLKGDYSLAILKSGANRTTLIRHLYPERASVTDDFGWSVRAEAIADFDGNGTYELVLVESNFAGEKATLFSYVNRELKAVAQIQDGA